MRYVGYQVCMSHRAVHVRWGVLYAHKATVAAVLAMTSVFGALPPSTALPSGLMSILLAAPCLMDFDPLRVEFDG